MKPQTQAAIGSVRAIRSDQASKQINGLAIGGNWTILFKQPANPGFRLWFQTGFTEASRTKIDAKKAVQILWTESTAVAMLLNLMRSLATAFFCLVKMVVLCVVLVGCRQSSPADRAISTNGDRQPTIDKSLAQSKPNAKPTTSPARMPQSYLVARVLSQPGCCDGSAGVALDADHFLVGNDEDSILRIYPRGESSTPVQTINLRKFLDLKKKDDESDLEGLARIGSTVYGIASHSRSKDGDKRKGRRRFFALEYSNQNNRHQLIPYGSPYTELLEAFGESPILRAINLEKAATRAGDEKDGLNIEGLASTPEGALLIGFRTPILRSKTLLIPLLNPRDVVTGEPPRFGSPKLITLDGMGIRGIEQHNGSYILTTETERGKSFPQLYQWDGTTERPTRLFTALPKSLNPESVIIFPDTGLNELHLLSDDGNEKIGKKACNDIKKDHDKRFRRLVLQADTSSL
ncbi:MAG: hypothetical protein M2R45_02686 [Verrucomicrobia subdivision 3 bacterium]|nr:hypothetical protein [Limisphaerales bacterium]MCS1415028.1 hypothetical protein [Limisphaerales bacterium]